MNQKVDSCNERSIVRFLQGALSLSEETQLERHLDHCDDCCDRLDSLTANPHQWKEVAAELTKTQSPIAGGANDEVNDDVALDFLGPTDDPHSLGRLAGYEIAGVIGVGGMGIVLKGRDQTLNRNVAIKVLRPVFASNAEARKRFAREARAAAAVVHENVISIYGVSVDATNGAGNTNAESKIPYLVMPYVRGESLQTRLNRQGALGVHEILRIAIQIADGLDAAHQQGLVHRDIKPANVLLPEGVERVKITDFGLARAADDASLTRTGVIAGTPQYMSPEQALGEPVTTQSDLFSLGSVMYAMCTGRIPFRAESPLGVLRRIVDDHPRAIQEINLDIPIWLSRLIEQLHAKTPEDRLNDAGYVRDLLKDCLSHVQQPTSIPLPGAVFALLSPTKSKTPIRSYFFGNLKGTLTMFATLALGILSIAMLPPLLQESANHPQDQEMSGDQNNQQSEFMTTRIGESEFLTKKYTFTFDDPTQVGVVKVDVNRGGIDVTGYDGDEIVMIVKTPIDKSKREGDEGLRRARVRVPDFDIRQGNNSITFDSSSYQQVMNVEVKVPFGTKLDLDSYWDGSITVRDVKSQMDIHSQNNDITLLNVSGSARVWSYNGVLSAQFRSVTKNAEIYFESYNGSIDLSLPSDYQARALVRSGTGEVLTDFDAEFLPAEPARIVGESGKTQIKGEGYLKADLNGGGPRLLLETEKGDIRIRRNKDKLRY